jgi:hypothetical protein
MDASISDLKKGDPLPSKDFVIRFVVATERDKKNKQIPAPRCFTLSEKDKKTDFGLSVEWSQMTTPEEILIRLGLSKKEDKKGKEIYKDYTTRELYAMNIGFLKTFSEITNVVYDPIPANVAHSLVLFKPETYEQAEPEIIATKIRDHAKDNKVQVNMQIVKEEVEKERK